MGIRENAIRWIASALGAGDLIKASGTGSTASPQTQSQLPKEWVTSTYAPGWPIQPIQRPEDVEIPREIDYPLAVNATLQPRTGYGLMPFAALKEAYETVAEIRLPISLLLREMMIFRPHLIDKQKGEIKKHPYEWLTMSPDGVTPFDVWLTRFLKSSLIFDAGALFYQQGKGTDIDGVRYIDGSTLFIMVDEHGQVPHPKQVSTDTEVLKKYYQKVKEWESKGKTIPNTTPAYAQVIKGTPFGWYNTDQIWYKPRSRRFDSPYGETTIEQAWAWILICANVTGFELAHYREGNMPEGWVTAPEGWSLERVAAFETAFNARMSSGPAERMRSRFLPYGSAWNETKKPDFPQQLYEQAANTVSLFYGVPPSEYGRTPGAGLGGKGFEDAMQSSLFRMGLYPLKTYVEGALNDVLKKAGVDDAIFELAFPVAEIDPAKHKESVIKMFGNGLITFNNALAQLGQDAVEGGDVHMIIMNGTATILEDFLASDEMSINPYEDKKDKKAKSEEGFPPNPDDEDTGGDEGNGKKPPPPGSPKSPNGKNGKNAEPKGDPTERKEPMSEKDKKIVKKMLEERTLTPEGVFYSIPNNYYGNVVYDHPVAKTDYPHVPAHPRNPKNQQFASKGRVSSEEAQRIATEFNVDLNQISLEQFRIMVETEANEHPVIVGDDLSIAGQIVVDHLSDDGESDEYSDYYQLTLKNYAKVQQAKELAKQNDGCMVALDLSDADAKSLLKMAKDMIPADIELEAVQQMHITLFYPGAMEEVQFTQAQLITAVGRFCNTHAPLKGVIGGLARFNGGEDATVTPVVALFDCPELPQFRQDLVELLHSLGIKEVNDDKHGFIPHITIAYLPAGTALKDNDFVLEPMPLSFSEVAVVWGETWVRLPLVAKENIQKAEKVVKFTLTNNLAKGCGVCPGDDDYYGAPVIREAEMPFPADNHKNEVEVVVMAPEGLAPRPALWKPEGGEKDVMQELVGGQLYPREEAAYLLDRSLGFNIVPLAYVAEVDEERGAVIYYSHDAPAGADLSTFDEEWIAKSAVIDYIMGQMDRHNGNHLTNPVDGRRLLLIDNGVSFPAVPFKINSQFFEAWKGRTLSDNILRSVVICVNDAATWADIERLVGETAADMAHARAEEILEYKIVPLSTPILAKGE